MQLWSQTSSRKNTSSLPAINTKKKKKKKAPSPTHEQFNYDSDEQPDFVKEQDSRLSKPPTLSDVKTWKNVCKGDYCNFCDEPIKSLFQDKMTKPSLSVICVLCKQKVHEKCGRHYFDGTSYCHLCHRFILQEDSYSFLNNADIDLDDPSFGIGAISVSYTHLTLPTIA